MIVLDTSVFIDLLIPFRKDRREIIRNIIAKIDEHGLPIYEPKIFIIELSGVLRRYRPRHVVEKHVFEIEKLVNIVEYEALHNQALEIALTTGCRATDAFFIATARYTNSILLSCDRKQIENAKKIGVEAYHLPEEYAEVIERLSKL